MEELEKVIGRLGWRTHEERNTEGKAIGLELERWTPAGEDWLVSLDGRDVCSLMLSATEQQLDFSIDAEAERWIPFRGLRGVPGTIREDMERNRD